MPGAGKFLWGISEIAAEVSLLATFDLSSGRAS